jgi:hypothetical protein
MAFLGGLAASLFTPLLGGLFSGGSGGGTQSPNSQGYGPAPDQSVYYGATEMPQYDQSILIAERQAIQDAADAKLAIVQSQAQAIIAQQQMRTEIEKMKITAQLSQQQSLHQMQLQASQAQLAQAQAQAQSASTTNTLPLLAAGAVLLVVLLR